MRLSIPARGWGLNLIGQNRKLLLDLKSIQSFSR